MPTYRQIAVAVVVLLGVFAYLQFSQPVVTATYDQFDRLVSVDYEPIDMGGKIVRPHQFYSRDNAEGCRELALFRDLKGQGIVAGRLKEVVIQAPTSLTSAIRSPCSR